MAENKSIVGSQTLGYGLIAGGLALSASSFMPAVMSPTAGGMASPVTFIGGLGIAGAGIATVISSK